MWEPPLLGRSCPKSTGESRLSHCRLSGGCLLRGARGPGKEHFWGSYLSCPPPSALRSPSLAEISAGPLFSVPHSLGRLLPSQMLLRELLLPLLLFPHPPLSSLLPSVCTHTPLQTHSPIVLCGALPRPSGFQMRPAEPLPPLPADPPLLPRREQGRGLSGRFPPPPLPLSPASAPPPPGNPLFLSHSPLPPSCFLPWVWASTAQPGAVSAPASPLP